MTYAAFRSSGKEYTSRPVAGSQAARVAWDVLSQEGDRLLVSMGLLNGLWMCVLPDGETDYVEADWVLTQTPRARKIMQSALYRRFQLPR